MIRSAKRKFSCNAFEENKGSSREIWKAIRTLTGSGKNRRDINNINIGEAVIDDKKLMAQHLDAHFSSIADRLRSTLPQVPSDPSKLQDFVRSRKSPDASYVIPSIVARLINFSFSSGSFPSRWKTALLCTRMVTHVMFRIFDQYLCYLSFLKLSRDMCMTPYTVI